MEDRGGAGGVPADHPVVAANTEEARAAGRISLRLQSRFEGLTRDFRNRMENLDEESVEAKINGAFSEYYLDHMNAVQIVEDNGIAISNNLISAADRIDAADGDAAEALQTEFPLPQDHPDMQAYYSPEHIAREAEN